jgi:hypothetical protein
MYARRGGGGCSCASWGAMVRRLRRPLFTYLLVNILSPGPWSSLRSVMAPSGPVSVMNTLQSVPALNLLEVNVVTLYRHAVSGVTAAPSSPKPTLSCRSTWKWIQTGYLTLTSNGISIRPLKFNRGFKRVL